MNRAPIWLLPFVMLSISTITRAAPLTPDSQRQFDQVIRPFLQSHCYKCHDDKKTRAGFRIDTLGTDFLLDKTADNWKEVYDNLGAGKMPPKKEPRPTADETKAIMDWIDREIRNAEQISRNNGARTRRLNRTEYFNTLRDLFSLEENYVRSLEDELPPDAKVDGFDRVASGLYIDQSQLAKYFDLADRVLSERVFTEKPKPTKPGKDAVAALKYDRESQGGRLTKVNTMGPLQSILDKSETTWMPTGATIYELKRGGIEYLCGGDRIFLGNHPSTSNGAGDGAGGGSWIINTYNFFSGVTVEGTYRLKFRAGAFAGKGKFAVENVRINFSYGKNGQLSNNDTGSVIIDAPLDEPREYVIDVYLHPRLEIAGRNSAKITWNGLPAFSQAVVRGRTTQLGVIAVAPEIYQLEDQLSHEYYMLAGDEQRKKTPPARITEIVKARFPEMERRRAECVQAYVDAKKPAYVYNSDYDLAAVPRLFMESCEVDGPIVNWPPKGRSELFFDRDDRPVDSSYIREIFARFLPRANRRAIQPKELDAVVSFVLKAQKADDLSGIDAVKEGIKAILCSPDFLMIEEPTGKVETAQALTDFELASRLSYFLWSTMPDGELIRLASTNTLHEPKILEHQVSRMIADPRAIGLIANFTGQWLQVRDFGKTMTDRNQYKVYTDDLQKSEWEEPIEFFKEVLRGNRSIITFVDSDFIVIDKRLATHYGIDGVREIDGFKPVAIKPESHRGGVLGMAGVLTYLTDGFRTLPVRRAAYVKDVMWNEPAKPPPPNVGDLPAVKPNLTVRQRLEEHRNSPACASCHASLDPFGVALENYDAIGLWRERQNGEGLRGDDKSPRLDVSGTLPSGRAFNSLAEYKQALLAEKEHFVRGFTRKMLTYALGRSVGATDRDLVDSITRKLEVNDYRMQTLVQAVVASEAFRMK